MFITAFKRRAATLIFIAAIVAFSPLFVHAQGFNFGLPQAQTITLSLTPEYPHPGETVTASVDSVDIDLGTSNITWKINGVTRVSGRGERQLEFTAGALGQTQTVRVDAVSVEGSSYSAQRTIVPSDIDVIWEGVTYTPPFYKGKPMYTQMSDLRVVAIPHIIQGGGELPAENLTYTWEVDGGVFTEGSGYGKTSIRIPGTIKPTPVAVTVTARTLSGNAVASRTIEVPVWKPKILFYEYHPLYGVELNKALLGEVPMFREEIMIQAYPYFFSNEDMTKISRKWSMNGNEMVDEANLGITLRNSENVTGKAELGLSLHHVEKILQFAENNLILSFTAREEGDQI